MNFLEYLSFTFGPSHTPFQALSVSLILNYVVLNVVFSLIYEIAILFDYNIVKIQFSR